MLEGERKEARMRQDGEARRPVGKNAGGGLCGYLGESADWKSEGIAQSGNGNKSPARANGIPVSAAAQ